MDLKNCVTETLVQIASGVEEANKQMVAGNLMARATNVDTNVRLIKFDITRYDPEKCGDTSTTISFEIPLLLTSV